MSSLMQNPGNVKLQCNGKALLYLALLFSLSPTVALKRNEVPLLLVCYGDQSSKSSLVVAVTFCRRKHSILAWPNWRHKSSIIQVIWKHKFRGKFYSHWAATKLLLHCAALFQRICLRSAWHGVQAVVRTFVLFTAQYTIFRPKWTHWY